MPPLKTGIQGDAVPLAGSRGKAPPWGLGQRPNSLKVKEDYRV